MIVEDCVEKMLAFKQRCPAVTFELAPNEFATTNPQGTNTSGLSVSVA